ncbi:hypothetical protein HS088_TW13G00928 [Tripterygium wilfordii]|uniref:Uncharacterized protein n=1 Tax=Tripterygium wilfordii TaxID=458696 RepID=A0A7J7CVG7_TRIWF|nr:hypothetical protein HS088_TW13G00928 [Tripterygium wilfordii]
MAASLTRFSLWLWGSKEKEPVSNASSRKVKRRWQSREDRGVERERAVVFVPSDGGVYLSGSESEGPDWSIGWVEPHGPNFRSDDEIDDGFAVLVPCYRPGCKELVEASTGQLLSAINNLPKESSSGGYRSLGDSILVISRVC